MLFESLAIITVADVIDRSHSVLSFKIDWKKVKTTVAVFDALLIYEEDLRQLNYIILTVDFRACQVMKYIVTTLRDTFYYLRYDLLELSEV